MGILNQIWWLLGFLMAAPLLVVGVQGVLAGNPSRGVLFLVLGVVALCLPEYLRWRILGGSSPFERVPLLRSRRDPGKE